MSKFLRQADRLVWSRFLNSPEGKQGIAFLRLACPNAGSGTDADLIRNSVGFDFWQKCLNELESLGEVPERQQSAENIEPLEN